MMPLTDEQRATVEANIGLVGRHMVRMRRAGVDDDQLADAYQDGMLGLIRAVQLWNPARSTLGTYADRWIRKAIQQGRRRREFEDGGHGFHWSLDAHIVLQRPAGYGRRGEGAAFGPQVKELPYDDGRIDDDVIDRVDAERAVVAVHALCLDALDGFICAGLSAGVPQTRIAAEQNVDARVVGRRVQRFRRELATSGAAA